MHGSILLCRSCSFAAIIWPSPSLPPLPSWTQRQEGSREQRTAAGPSRSAEGSGQWFSFNPSRDVSSGDRLRACVLWLLMPRDDFLYIHSSLLQLGHVLSVRDGYVIITSTDISLACSRCTNEAYRVLTAGCCFWIKL